ncbi:MAG: hypothetical protein ACFFD4_30995 [Candidatus Odinarchaeota archaeon]
MNDNERKIRDFSSKLKIFFENNPDSFESSGLNELLQDFNLSVDAPGLTVYITSTRFRLHTFEITTLLTHTAGIVFYLDDDQRENLQEGLVNIASDVIAMLVDEMDSCHTAILEILKSYKRFGSDCSCADPTPYSYPHFDSATPEVRRLCRNPGCGGKYPAK